MRKILTLLLAGAVALSVTACAGGTAPASSAATPASQAAPAGQPAAPAPAAAPVEGKTNVTFWHSMGGAGGEAITKFVADFNAENDSVNIIEQFQGAYDEAITKLKSAVVSGQGPEIMQVYEIGSRWMIDSGYIVPMQEAIDRNGFDTTQLEPNIAAYYTIGGVLNSMPFNSSTPLMYYNKDAFAAAGLDPEAPPKDIIELEAAATALTDGDKKGMTIVCDSWFLEQFTYKQGKHYANNGNGRDDRATAVEFDSNGAGLVFFNMIDDFNKKGILANYGHDSGAANNAFGAGEVFINFASTASLPGMLKAVNNNFELGTAYLPALDPNVDGGVSIGGGSLWMMDKGDDASKDAAWKFIEYCVQPEVQVYWHTQTGYFPITTKAYDLQSMKDQMVENPLFVTAINQLHDSKPSSQGALLGVFTEARQITVANWEEMLAGSLTPQEVVDSSAKGANAAIEQYNLANS